MATAAAAKISFLPRKGHCQVSRDSAYDNEQDPRTTELFTGLSLAREEQVRVEFSESGTFEFKPMPQYCLSKD